MVSLIWGAAKVVGSYGHASMATTFQKSGLELFINKKSATGYFAPCDTNRISWRNARYLLNLDSNLNEILQKVGNWYNLKVVIGERKNSIEKSDTPLTSFCSAPLDSVLKIIETTFHVTTIKKY